MSDVTRILSEIESGDPSAPEKLLLLVYDELRNLAAAQLARENPGQTLQATALVHEVYLRMFNPNAPRCWANRRHFFSAVGETMRRILIDKARRKLAQRRGGGVEREPVELDAIASPIPVPDLMAVDESLDELERADSRKAVIVKLRCFVGLTMAEIASALGVSPATIDREWAYARAWLHSRLRDDC